MTSATVTYPSLAITKWELWIGGELGSPPFNSGLPPVSVAFLYVCSFNSDSMGNAFLWPKINHYTAALEDQAYVGSYNDFQSDAVKVTAETFWSSLRQGNTVQQACINAFDTYKNATQVANGVPWIGQATCLEECARHISSTLTELIYGRTSRMPGFSVAARASTAGTMAAILNLSHSSLGPRSRSKPGSNWSVP